MHTDTHMGREIKMERESQGGQALGFFLMGLLGREVEV